MSSSESFAGKTVIVTGASSGIGRATAVKLLHAGARVIATDIAIAGLHELQSEQSSFDITVVAGDVTQGETVLSIMDAAGGIVHGLANVAGIMDALVPAHEVTDELWERVMRVNVTGPMMLTRAVLPGMIASDGGSIVNVASEAAIRGSAAGAAYTTSKHAIVGYTRSVAFMYGPANIRANAVAPGPVATKIETRVGSDYASRRHSAVEFLEMPSAVPPEALAETIVWLLSDASANVNGVLLPSDGGWSVI